MKGFTKRARQRACAVTAVAAATAMAAVPAAEAVPRPPSLGPGVASPGQLSIQQYNFAGYISDGSGELNPPAPSTPMGRVERVFQFLQDRGVRNIELYGHPGNPFPGNNPATPLNVQGLLEYRALGDKYGLHFAGRHGDVSEANWDNQIAAAKILGQDYIGSAGTAAPGQGTYANTVATAATLNRLGQRSVEAGVGPVYIHNHQGEFNTRYVENGVDKSAWEIIMERTDPRYVVAEIDLLWAADGLSNQDAVTALINRFTTRVRMLHVKDGINVVAPGNASPRVTGTAEMNFTPMLTASRNRVQYYHLEQDGANLQNSSDSIANIQGEDAEGNRWQEKAPTLQAFPPTFEAGQTGGTTGPAQTVKVTNTGNAPLTITAIAIQAASQGVTVVVPNADAAAGNDFTVTGETCTSGPVAPNASCNVSVAFKPTRAVTTSVARLQFTSNADDASERVLLVAKSGNAVNVPVNAGGAVPGVLSLSVPAPATLGPFTPGVARDYTASVVAQVLSTTGDAALSVTDASGSSPGHLVNGAFTLAQPLNVRATNAANPGTTYAPLGAAPLALLSWTGPTTNDIVTLGFRQSIGAADVLRQGTYAKALTFTLSTTTP